MGWKTDEANPTSTWRDHVIMWVKDASRAIDYIETRPDLDHEKIAYYGYSWGAVMGAYRFPPSIRASKSPSSRLVASSFSALYPR